MKTVRSLSVPITVAGALAVSIVALGASVAAAAPPGDTGARFEALPTRPLQPPIRDDVQRTPDNPSDRLGRRVAPPPRPEGRIQVIPGVSYLHKEGSTSIMREARQRRPGSEPRLPDGNPTIAPDPRPGVEPGVPPGNR